MKSINILCLLFIIFSCNPNKALKDSAYYVINIEGAKVYKNADLHSQIINTIQAGERIEPLELTSTSQNIVLGTDLKLSGLFMKVSNKDSHGYIFSSDVSRIKPSIIYADSNFIQLSLLGTLIKKEKRTRNTEIRSQSYEIDEIVNEYENGIYSYVSFDGCFDHKYESRNLDLNEVYHQMVNQYVISGESIEGFFISIPEYRKTEDNIIYFKGEVLTEDLKIEILDSGDFLITSYDCT